MGGLYRFLSWPATEVMDWVEEILDISHALSTKKIKKLMTAIADRVPHQWLPHLVCNTLLASTGGCALRFQKIICKCAMGRSSLVDLAGYADDRNT